MTGRRWVLGWVCAAGGLLLAVAGFAAASSGDVGAAFQPWASSFVSASTGFVLGGAGCRFGVNGAQAPCRPVVVTTGDGGASWRTVSSPPTELVPYGFAGLAGRQVRGITFADSRNGWLFAPGLWATHDGGEDWKRLAMKQQVTDVVASGGWVYATTASFPATPALWRSPVGRDDWQPVRSLPAMLGSTSSGLLAASGKTAWVGLTPLYSQAPPELWRTTDGTSWQRIGNPCVGVKQSLYTLTATSSSDLLMYCASNGSVEFVTSTDGGIHSRRMGTPPASE
jgi:hypothetical protein